MMAFSGNYKIDGILGTQPAIYEASNNLVYVNFGAPNLDSSIRLVETPTQGQQSAVMQMLDYITLITGVQFTTNSNAGAGSTITFTTADLPDDILGVTLPGLYSDYTIAIDTITYETTSDFSPGGISYQVLLHEMGHALGLDHPFEGPYKLPEAEDNAANTLMSYTWSAAPRAYFSPYDLLALQWIYGSDGVGGTWGIDGSKGPQQAEYFAPITHTVHADAAQVSEGARTVTFTVTRSGNIGVPSTVTWSAGGSVDKWDFADSVMPSGIVSFAADQTERAITLALRDDTDVEDPETVVVTLGNVTGNGAMIGNANSDGVLVTDNEVLPTVSIIAPAPLVEGSDGAPRMLSFLVEREGNTSGSTEVFWSFEAFDTSADDFKDGALPTGGLLSFAPGEYQKRIDIGIAADSRVEPDESFGIRLAVTHLGNPGTVFAAGTILNDDNNSSFTIAAGEAAVAEGNSGQQAIVFTITRSGSAAQAVSVNWTRSGSLGSDDIVNGPASGTLGFAAGESSKTLSFDLLGDTRIERDEALTVTLTGTQGTGVGLGSARQATTTVTNDDGRYPVAIVAAQGSVAEGAAGAAPSHLFTLTRSGDLSEAASIPWSIGGTVDAKDFADGQLLAGNVNFAAGQASATITLTTAGDDLYEPDETLLVQLGQGDLLGAAPQAGSAGVTLLNDDDPDEFRISPLTPVVAEGSVIGAKTSFRFEVTRLGHVDQPASVDYRVIGSGAYMAEASDFGSTMPAGTLKWAAGETRKTLLISVLQDTTVERDEGFSVLLSNGRGSAVSADHGTAAATIRSDELPGPRSVAGQADRFERVQVPGQKGEFALSYDPASHGTKVVDQVAGRAGTTTLKGVDVLQFASGDMLRIEPSLQQKQLLQLGQAMFGSEGLDSKLYGIGLVAIQDQGMPALASYAAGAFFGDADAHQMAGTVLAHLGIDAAALGGEPAWRATLDVLTGMFNGSADARGAALLTVLQVLGGLEGDATYGKAATAFNTSVGNEWLGEFAGDLATLVGVSQLDLVDLPRL